MPKESITHERLRELVDYDPETGVFRWKRDMRGRRGSVGRVGMQVGSVRPDGRRVISLDGKKYLAGRLAWFYTYRVWPEPTVDHINGDYTDDRLENLRELSFGGQVQNRGVQKNSSSRVPGVSWYKADSCWRARIKLNGKEISLGYFKNFDDAVAARRRAEAELHPFSRRR